MRIHIIYGYRGVPSDGKHLEAGEHDLPRTLATYLVDNGHAVALEEPEPKPTRKRSASAKTGKGSSDQPNEDE